MVPVTRTNRQHPPQDKIPYKLEAKMKKIMILSIVLLLAFTFCGKKETVTGEQAPEKTAGELFSLTMGNMQRISIACATLYKNFNVIPRVASIKELAVLLAHDKYNKDEDAKPLVELVTGVKSKQELEEPGDKESEALLLELLSKKLDKKALADYKHEKSGYLLKKLLLKDAWGNDFYFKSDENNWWIGSAGSDGLFEGFDQEGDYKHLDEDGNDISSGKDIIFSGKGGFVYGPGIE